MADMHTEPTGLTVPESSEGQRLDAFLAEALPDVSRSRLKDWVAAGRVTVNGHAAKPSARLQGGEEIVVEPLPRAVVLPEPEDIPLDILYEDEDVLVVNKPAGMVVHPGAGVHTGTLVHAVLHHCPALSSAGGETRPGIVHRLDRLTSGCIVVAKNDAAHLALAEQLADRSMSRVYLTWSWDARTRPKGSWTRPSHAPCTTAPA
jgi:23S rRNA pseudouridine1911/1915/1917 synthase